MSSLLDQLAHSPEPAAVAPAELRGAGLVLRWSPAGLELERDGQHEALTPSALQLSWSMATGRPRGLLARFLLRPPHLHPVLYAELRSRDGQRLRLASRVPPERLGLLDGLPRLATSAATEVPLDELIALLQAATALGAGLVRSDEAGAGAASPADLLPQRRALGWRESVMLLFQGGQTVGWAAVIGLQVFVVPFGLNSDAMHLFDWRAGEVARTEGVVTSSEETNSSNNGVTIVEVCYAFDTAAGERREGCSYHDGGVVAPGTTVPIEYRDDLPAVSVISGMRQGTFGPIMGSIMLGLMGLVVVLTLVFGLRGSIRRRDLLVWGHAGRAFFLDAKEVGHRTSGGVRKPLYHVRVGFTGPDGTVHTLTQSLVDKLEPWQRPEGTPLLYAPDQPSSLALLSALPVVERPDGTLAVTVRKRGLIITLTALAVLGVYAWLLLPG